MFQSLLFWNMVGPLGSIMRAWMQAYMETQDFRQQANQATPAELRSNAEVSAYVPDKKFHSPFEY